MNKYSKILTKDFLIKEYIINKKSSAEIAKEIGCVESTICYNLKKNGIKIRSNKESHTKQYNILTKKFLQREYITNKKSCRQIGDMVGCCRSVIRKFIKKYGIPIRTKSDYAKGKNNSNYRDGRYLKQYYCIDCQKQGIKTEINKDTALYGGGRCIFCSNKGKNNTMYGRTGKLSPQYIEGLDREYPLKFRHIREAIRERDNYQCQICGKSTKKNGRRLPVHHIGYNKKNLNFNNLITLCDSCHSKTNTNRNIYIEYFNILMTIISY